MTFSEWYDKIVETLILLCVAFESYYVIEKKRRAQIKRQVTIFLNKTLSLVKHD